MMALRLPRVLSLLVLFVFVAVVPARAEESEAPKLHEIKSAGSEAPQLHSSPISEEGKNGDNASHQQCAAGADCHQAPVPADDEEIESVLDIMKAAPEVSMEYFVHMPSGPNGEEQDHNFPLKFSPSQIASLRGGDKEAGQATLLLAIYQARPHILALKPWACQVCGKPARTTLGSPAFIPATTPGIIVDTAPFVLCGDPACEDEAQRQTKEILQNVNLQVAHGEHRIPVKLVGVDHIINDKEAVEGESGEELYELEGNRLF